LKPEILLHENEHYILASSPRVDDRTRVLKQGETFIILDRFGDTDLYGGGALGLFHEGTRFLSVSSFRLFGTRPLLLSSTVLEDNDCIAVDLTNLDVHSDGMLLQQRGTVHVFRTFFLWNAVCFERFRLRNFGLAPIEIPMTIRFDADFADIFEVRGSRREKRGFRLPDQLGNSSAVLGYRGLDGGLRRTRVEWSLRPREITSGEAAFVLRLEPHQEATLLQTVRCEIEKASRSRVSVPVMDYETAMSDAREALRSMGGNEATVYTSNEQFNEWLFRSSADLHMMLSDTEYGRYPYAGVPWFSTVFGRDGIITAFETLWLNPEIARGVLSVLAATQAKELNPERDAAPGKILHEMRNGEMAALGEIPFGRYYGTVDATPLFVMLASAYHEWTADRAFLEGIWPNIERALDWIDRYGDVDRDGFVEYARKSSRGLDNQGWKDSLDAVFHADGKLAEGPIALCEVQAYVYGARRGAAELALALGERERAGKLLDQAEDLRQKFEQAYWNKELKCYALALDRDKKPCAVRTSNAGHCLFSGIASPERALVVSETLLDERCFSGWGIRTLAEGEARYNPMSYHNGSVWPHDNAIIGQGLSRYRLKNAASKLLTGLFDTSIFVDLHRLPELFCGFDRRKGEGPTAYPLACSPQAWAAGSVFLLLQSCLGMSVHGVESQLRFSWPLLPSWLEWVQIGNLKVGRGKVDVSIERLHEEAAVSVRRREGPVEVNVIK
jgi:glycogen debranching enzyme